MIPKNDSGKLDIRNEMEQLRIDMQKLMTPDAVKELEKIPPTFYQFLIRWTDLHNMTAAGEIADEVETRMTKLFDERARKFDRYMSWWNTALRGAVYIAISVVLSLMIMNKKISNRLDTIENMIKQHIEQPK
jgi:hypothetical protein